MFAEKLIDWQNATEKCKNLNARLPVLSDKQAVDIVKDYLKQADFNEVRA